MNVYVVYKIAKKSMICRRTIAISFSYGAKNDNDHAI